MAKLTATALALSIAFATAAQAQQIERRPDGDILTTQTGAVIRLPACNDSEGVRVRFSVTANLFQDLRGPTSAWDAFSSYSFNGPQTMLNPDTVARRPEVVAFLAEHECVHHERGHIRAAYLNQMQGRPSTTDPHDLELEADCGATQNLQRKYGYGEREIREIFASFPPQEKTSTHPATGDRLTMALGCLRP